MASKNNSDPAETPNEFARLDVSDADRAKAIKWFERARDLGEKRQFDYAIEYYVNGLEFSPDSVDDGCQPLRGCAIARQQTGGKKPGFKDSMKRSMTDKDPKKALVNALWLFGHDPTNLAYAEGVLKAAGRLRAEDTAKWAGDICLKLIDATPKVSTKQFMAIVGQLEELGQRADERKEVAFGVEAFQMAVDALNKLRQRYPNDRTVEVNLKNMSTKLTILRGKYSDGESFRDSIADKSAQKDLHDEQRSVQAVDRVAELINKAEAAYKADPEDGSNLTKLIELLCRGEQEVNERRAIEVLMEAFKSSGDYRRKLTADDIQIKILNRAVRAAVKSGDENEVKKRQIAALKYELTAFKERLEKYPTDNRIKYEYGVRLFRAGKYDEAIPVFQAARSDPKNRTACALYLGRCFFKKSYHAQVITVLTAGLQEHPYEDDEIGKGMLYWLGRAQEANGDATAARDTFGKIVQIDYNYRDVRSRLEGLPGS